VGQGPIVEKSVRLPAMKKADRVNAILLRLATIGSVEVEALAADLEMSPATIRRDLDELAEQSLLVRTHGGARVHEVNYEVPLRYRTGSKEEKRRIGMVASGLVSEGAVVGISGGTTTTQVARALASQRNLTVVTNALNIAAELALRPNVRMVVTGGIARSASFELVGSIAEETIAVHNLDILFLGADGVDAKAGCTTHDSAEARTNAAMVWRAKRVVVVADRSKLGKVAFAKICDIDAVDTLITNDVGPPAHGAVGNGDELEGAASDARLEGRRRELAELGIEILSV
jgi:DeoR family transcriptional regulator of aga operon